MTSCFDPSQLNDIKEFLVRRWSDHERRSLAEVNRQYDEFIRAFHRLASPVKPVVLNFDTESLSAPKARFTSRLEALRDYLALRKTEIIFTLAGYQLRLEDFATLLLGHMQRSFS